MKIAWRDAENKVASPIWAGSPRDAHGAGGRRHADRGDPGRDHRTTCATVHPAAVGPASRSTCGVPGVCSRPRPARHATHTDVRLGRRLRWSRPAVSTGLSIWRVDPTFRLSGGYQPVDDEPRLITNFKADRRDGSQRSPSPRSCSRSHEPGVQAASVLFLGLTHPPQG